MILLNKNTNKSVEIKKVVKEGTNRIFFYPMTLDGKRLNRTLYARKYDAINLGKLYINQ